MGSLTPISPAAIRRIILEQSHRARVGHIGSALSVADIVAAIYGRMLRISAHDDPERDRFVLSKGHAALALYAALHLAGRLSADQLNTYCGDDSLLGVHPEHSLPGVDFCTGSLGQGLSFGTGAGLAARLSGSSRRVIVLLSDAECNEGSVWEAAMFAAHHKLGNLLAIVDANGQQALGYTKNVLDLSPLADRWRAVGWDAREVDGHDVEAICAAAGSRQQATGRKEADSLLPAACCLPPAAPRVLIADTVFGKGVSFMERQIKWHYWPMSDDEFQQAVREIGAAA
jgi:transketolase